jgi:RNA polymerase sigma factor (sigma-70 family)
MVLRRRTRLSHVTFLRRECRWSVKDLCGFPGYRSIGINPKWPLTCIRPNVHSSGSHRERLNAMGAVTSTADKVPTMPVWRGEQQEAITIRQILGGRRDLLANLSEPHLKPLWWTVNAKVRDDADTDDIVQEAVFKSLTHLGLYRFEASFRSWLTQIGINEVSQLWRKRFASSSAPWDRQAIAAIKVADPKESLFNGCTRPQNARLLQLTLASLPEKYRLIVRMRDLEVRTIIEVADKLRLTTAGVKTRHHRGRLQMARFLYRTNKPTR